MGKLLPFAVVEQACSVFQRQCHSSPGITAERRISVTCFGVGLLDFFFGLGVVFFFFPGGGRLGGEHELNWKVLIENLHKLTAGE